MKPTRPGAGADVGSIASPVAVAMLRPLAAALKSIVQIPFMFQAQCAQDRLSRILGQQRNFNRWKRASFTALIARENLLSAC
jgi:hypothetical protein